MENDNGEKHIRTKTDKRLFIVIVFIHIALDALLPSLQALHTFTDTLTHVAWRQVILA